MTLVLVLAATLAVPLLDQVTLRWFSRDLNSRGVLVANAAKATAAHGMHPPRPEHWGGYRLVPDTWELWQGRRSRLHDRVRFRLDGELWVKERLAP